MPFQKEARTIIRIFMKKLLEDCPDDVRPKLHTQDSYWSFANGSELHIHGVNNGHEDNLRGHEAFLAIVDEAGSVDELKYLTNDILMPQLLTTGGKFIAASTPPPIPGHYFKTLYDKAKEKRNLSEYNIYENTSLTTATIQTYMEECGGETSDTWQREYLIQFEIDMERMIIPEWNLDYVREFDPPSHHKYYDKYIGMDLGVVVDFTAILFGFYHFEEAVLYIEDEITSRGPNQTTSLLYELAYAKEVMLGYSPEVANGPKSTVRTRICDNNNPQLLQDMMISHNYHLTAVRKATLPAMVNNLRSWVTQGRIIIHPRCKMLIGCLNNGFWVVSNATTGTRRKLKFGHDAELGHFDHLAALMYMIRGVAENANPIPYTANYADTDHYISPDVRSHQGDASLENLANAFNRK
jgi:hypothetical protein